MKYKYLLEDKVKTNWNYSDLNNKKILHILCYNIESQCKYPFLQFMMEKIPFCENIIKEQFILPYIFIDTDINKEQIVALVLNKIKHNLELIGYDSNKLTNDIFKGIIYFKDENPYILVNISNINLYCLPLIRTSLVWFVLPSEIINTQHIFNIEIDKDVSYLFIEYIELCLLIDIDINKPIIIPDTGYTYIGDEYKKLEFESVFGVSKRHIYKSCSEYYYFYRSFFDIQQINTSGYVMRYAIFIEGKIYVDNEFLLSDNEIEKLYPEPCIIISIKNNNNSNLLVKDYDNFLCLSYYKL